MAGVARTSRRSTPSAQRPAPTPAPAGAFDTSTGIAEIIGDPADPTRATLYVNGVPSSPLFTAAAGNLLDLEFEYLQQLAAILDSPLVAPAGGPLAVLHLGGGACALARHLDASRPGSRQVVVEVDAALARHVREHVDLPRSPALRLQVGDARARLATRHDASADAIVRDAFAGDTTPRHLATREFLLDAARVLRRGGIYLANVVDRTGALAGASLRDELATAADVFGGAAHVALVGEPAVLRRRRYGNVVLVASPVPLAAPRGIDRVLRGGPAPAHWVPGEELSTMMAQGHVIHDAA